MKSKEDIMSVTMQDPHAEEKHNLNTNTMSELKVSGKIEKILPIINDNIQKD